MSDTDSNPSTPRCSVIIPTYNAASTIRLCLQSIFASEGVAYEVIVVNDNSTDESKKIAVEFPCQVIDLKRNIMAANCRNLGAELAKGEFLVFFDSDQIMHSDTLVRFIEVFQENPSVDAVVGSFQYDTPMQGFLSKFKNLRHHHVHQTAHAEGATLASGLTAIRKSVFDRNGASSPPIRRRVSRTWRWASRYDATVTGSSFAVTSK